ncbi:hypothetical protein, partial [Pseudomonas sp. EA_15y_Pfl1_P101]|uniref:hypothetical protein n=1 Tax=Pseudomonas sp. EA_15y_Pfl1_P101 TaxID=3088684 RepID=UPI0030D73038
MPTKKKPANAAARELPSIPQELIEQFVKGPMSAEAIQEYRKRSTKHTYNQVRFPFTVAFPVSSSTVTTLRSLLPWMHAATA